MSDFEYYNEPKNRIWALREASKPGGFMPNTKMAAEFLRSLEADGLVSGANTEPAWRITDKGCAELVKLEFPLR